MSTRLALMSLIASSALAGLAQAATPTLWVPILTQEALDSGFLSRLPPNISLVFGLAKPQEGTDVRQLLDKEGHRVRTFNVCVANHNDVVLFNVDAQSGAIMAYLLSADGQLRKAVAYKKGDQARDLSAADAKTGLAHERQFWAARAKKSPQAQTAPAPAPKSEPSH